MQNKTILLVEDEPIIAADLARMLRDALGCRVVALGQGQQVLQWLAKELADLVLLNFRQEGAADGMEMARIVRSRHLTPVLLITGVRQADLEQAPAYYAGQDWLLKPFTERQFIGLVIAALRG